MGHRPRVSFDAGQSALLQFTSKLDLSYLDHRAKVKRHS
jgi:hypothetical protein